jgi:predicted Zn-dependent protease
MTNTEKVCEKIFKLAGKAQCEVIAETRNGALTRFADNVISQNVASSSLNFTVRLLDSGRTSKVRFNQTDDASLKHAVTSGLEILKKQKKDPALLPLAKPVPLGTVKNLYFRETEELTPAYRAGRAAELAKACKKASQTAYGTFENGAVGIVLANNLGLRASHLETYAVYSVTVRDRDGFGWAETPAFDARKINFAELNETARAKAAAGRAPRDVKPGRYTVVLEPQAAAELASYLAVYGFGGQFYNEGRSFARGKLGKRVLSPLLTITDDALGGAAPGIPFDFEGRPRQRVTLVENGVLKAIVHDRKTAKAAGTASTGHALPQPSHMGPIPLNLAVKPGKGTLEDLIRGTGRGILVTQFHYTNMLKPQTVEITGTTRNGTFMIENGKITHPVKNLRFTQGLAEAFAELDAVGGEASNRLVWGQISCPPLRLRNFNFSSATKF